MQSAMKTLGEFLQEIRKDKKARLEDVAKNTRIGLDHLEALEADRFEKIPSEAIARGFVRSYVKCMGIDEKEALILFDRTARPFYRKQNIPKYLPGINVALIKPHEGRSKHSSKIAVIIFFGIVFSVLYLVALEKADDQVSSSAPLQQEADFEKLPQQDSVVHEDALTTDTVAINQPGSFQEKDKGLGQPAELLQLTIKAMETTWVFAEIDGDEFKEVLLKPGEKINWFAQERFNLSLGNAGGVDVHLNGRPLESFGPSGTVVSNILLTSDDRF